MQIPAQPSKTRSSDAPANSAEESNQPVSKPTPVAENEESPQNVVSGAIETTDKELKDFAQSVNAYSPHPIVSAGVVIVVFLVLGKLVDWLVTGILAKLVNRTRTDFDNKVLALLHRPIFLSVLLVGLGCATYLLNQSQTVTSITIQILQSIAVYVWFRFGLQLNKTILDELENGPAHFVTSNTKPLLVNTISIILIALAIYVIFLIWGINITAWIASAGIIGLAVSFAAKDTLANMFGGVAIFADKPFKLGDYVVLEGGARGVITQIGVRSTRILTRDDVEIIIPNGILATTTIVNESGGPHEKFRIRVKIGVAYGSDLDLVEEALLGVAATHPDVCETPEPRVRLRGFGDFSLDHELLCWVDKPVHKGRVLHELNRGIYKAFNTNKIEIPFPRQEINITRNSEA